MRISPAGVNGEQAAELAQRQLHVVDADDGFAFGIVFDDAAKNFTLWHPLAGAAIDLICGFPGVISTTVLPVARRRAESAAVWGRRTPPRVGAEPPSGCGLEPAQAVASAIAAKSVRRMKGIGYSGVRGGCKSALNYSVPI